MLQIVAARHDQTGRAVAPAEPSDIYTLARDVHELLAASGDHRSSLWCWDDFPEEGISTSDPMPPQGE